MSCFFSGMVVFPIPLSKRGREKDLWVFVAKLNKISGITLQKEGNDFTRPSHFSPTCRPSPCRALRRVGKNHAQGKAYAHAGRDILHARPKGKAQKHTYGDVAGEAWTFLFFVVHKLQSISWFVGALPDCGLGCTAIKE